MKGVIPFLWFDDDAEGAITFYTALIPDSEIVDIQRYPAEVPGMGGNVMQAHFRISGRDYYAMDAGPQFPFTAAVSLFVHCADQAEIDRYWDAFVAAGAEEQPCGWLKDRWGLSWQIVPDQLMALLHDTDLDRSQRVVQAMLQMHKLDIAALEEAAAAES